GWSYPSVTFQSPAFASRYHRPATSRTRAPHPSTMQAPASARSNHSRIGATPCHPAYVVRVSGADSTTRRLVHRPAQAERAHVRPDVVDVGETVGPRPALSRLPPSRRQRPA